MVRNPEILEKFEKGLLVKNKRTPLESIKIYDEMFNLAVKMQVLPKKNPLEGIENKINFARILNGIK